MVVFLFVESKIASQPFLPARVFFKRALFACSICYWFPYAVWLGIMYHLPSYWQAVESFSATQSVLRLLPGTVAGIVGSLLADWALKRTGSSYMLTVASSTVSAVGVIPIMMFAGWTSQSIWGIWAGTVLCGLFYNVGATVTLVALSKLFLNDHGWEYDWLSPFTVSRAGREDQALAIASLHLFRTAVGIAVSSVVAQQMLRRELRSFLKDSIEDTDLISQKVRQSLEFIATLPPELQDLVRDYYRLAIARTFILNFGLIVAAMGTSYLKASSLRDLAELRRFFELIVSFLASLIHLKIELGSCQDLALVRREGRQNYWLEGMVYAVGYSTSSGIIPWNDMGKQGLDTISFNRYWTGPNK